MFNCKKDRRSNVIKYLSQYLNTTLLIFLIFLTVLGMIILMTTPYIYGIVIDMLEQNNIYNLKWTLLVYILLQILLVCISAIQDYFVFWTTNKIGNKLKGKFFKHIICINMIELESFSTGELMSRLENDIPIIIKYFFEVVVNIVMIIINIVIPIVFILNYNIYLSIYTFFFLPLMFLPYFFFKTKLRYWVSKRQNSLDKYTSFINNFLSKTTIIKAYSMEKSVAKRYCDIQEDQFKILKRYNTINILNYSVSDIIINIFNISMIGIASMFIFKGQLTIGNLIAFNMYVQQLMFSFNQIKSFASNRQEAIVSLKRLVDVENLSEEEINFSNESNTNSIKFIESIIFDNVNFKYCTTGFELRNISFIIKEPGIYSIVGKNGVGKSTILKLLLGFYLPSNGEILINSISYNKLSLSEIRKVFSYIPKDTFIFNDTLFNNLSIINPNLSIEDVKLICKKVGLDKFFKSQPQEYNTLLGENGICLSSGLKQRLNFARALASQRLVILLDEVTSDLDGEVALSISECIKNLSKTHIIISISHKLDIVKISKLILLLNDGNILDIGSHKHLLNNETYKKIFGIV